MTDFAGTVQDLNQSFAVTVLPLQPTAQPHPVQIAVDVELQQIGWRIAGAARRLRRDPRIFRGNRLRGRYP